MRRWKWAAVVLGLVLAAPAWAQRTVTFGGVDPLKIVNQPIDTSNSVVPIAQPQRLANVGFSLRNILPRVGLPSAKPVIGRSLFPTPQNMPGANYLRAFHYQRPQPVKP
ncbi:MAG TPA: hypothetical protein VNK04_19480 [Gemmataceae bacterium]|nr:hypothetical protein [Gemmataceae bacterium]